MSSHPSTDPLDQQLRDHHRARPVPQPGPDWDRAVMTEVHALADAMKPTHNAIDSTSTDSDTFDSPVALRMVWRLAAAALVIAGVTLGFAWHQGAIDLNGMACNLALSVGSTNRVPVTF